MTSKPVNQRRRDTDAISADVDYALALVRSMEHAFDLTDLQVDETHMVEIGPGINLGAQLILASRGAKVTVADRFLLGWDDAYHPLFYRALRERCGRAFAELDAVIAGGDHRSSSIVMLEEPAERLSSIASASVDLVYSTAVLEHVRDMAETASELMRITRIGGWGFHQIDMRHHRNFARPLEHLLLSDEVFEAESEATNCESGSRLRSLEYRFEFERAGFTVTDAVTNMHAEEAYLREMLPKLRRTGSSYRDWPECDLRKTSGFFVLKRGDDVASSRQRDHGTDALSLAASLKATSRRYAEERALHCRLSLVLETERIHPLGGHRWRYMLPFLKTGDSVEEGSTSSLVLTEDGSPIGPAHSSLVSIADVGGGRYAHWMRELHFSTTDGSSPIDNGRVYAIAFHQDALVERIA